jgi:hypothetical protein
MSLITTVKKIFPELEEVKQNSKSLDHCFTYSARQNGEHYTIKLSFRPLSRFYNNYVVESQIYSHILSNLQTHTYHIPSAFSTGHSSVDGISHCELRTIQNWDVQQGSLDFNSVQALSVRNEGSETLESLWVSECDNTHILFQVLYTIACFERVGLRHNDLHPGNIYIKTEVGLSRVKYQIGEKVVSFNTRKLVTVVNYEHSSIYNSQVERNGYLDYLHEFQDTHIYSNGLNEGHDAFKFLSSYNKGSLRIWLEFVCPKLFSVNYENNTVPQNINPRNFIPDTLTLLTSLVNNFPNDFTDIGVHDNSELYSDVWCLPDNTAMRPLVQSTLLFTVYNSLVMTQKYTTHICRELLDIGYNWKLQSAKLFLDIYRAETFQEPFSEVQRACIKVTNPFRTEDCTKLETHILNFRDKLGSVRISQKYCWYPKSDKLPDAFVAVYNSQQMSA